MSFGFRRDLANSRLDVEVAGVDILQMTTTAVTIPAAITSGLTIVAGGLTATAGGVTITAGGVTYAGRSTVDQGGTDHTAGVTISANSGIITLANADLAAGTEVRFVVTNTKVAVGDVIALCIGDYADGGGMGTATVEDVAAGAFTVLLSETIAANAFNDDTTLNFVLIQSNA
ncbi:hypothetical protein LCGC14_3156890 [marine sediment metagenome]|uniref:Uncharacterized protein n=1 Tax=marine sediment metagenome TaxID=412755 RepID=A0A0F8VSD1_9ZZZZ